jgi:hypothetical protein
MVTRQSNRYDAWNDNTTSSRTAVMSNRGPLYLPGGSVNNVPPSERQPHISPAFAQFGIDSNTLLIHGPETEWQGVVAYGDGHVIVSRDGASEDSPQIKASSGDLFPDHLFVMERTDSLTTPTDVIEDGSDAYMRPYWRGLSLRETPNQNEVAGYVPTYSPTNSHVWID